MSSDTESASKLTTALMKSFMRGKGGMLKMHGSVKNYLDSYIGHQKKLMNKRGQPPLHIITTVGLQEDGSIVLSPHFVLNANFEQVSRLFYRPLNLFDMYFAADYSITDLVFYRVCFHLRLTLTTTNTFG